MIVIILSAAICAFIEPTLDIGRTPWSLPGCDRRRPHRGQSVDEEYVYGLSGM